MIGCEGVAGCDQQLFPHAGHLRAVQHELHQSIRQMLQQGQRDLVEGSEKVCQEGERLDLSQFEIQVDMPIVVCHLLRLQACSAVLM